MEEGQRLGQARQARVVTRDMQDAAGRRVGDDPAEDQGVVAPGRIRDYERTWARQEILK